MFLFQVLNDKVLFRIISPLNKGDINYKLLALAGGAGLEIMAAHALNISIP
jgi:hypothetical protein